MANNALKNTSSQQNRIEAIVGDGQREQELLTVDALLSHMKQVDEAIKDAKFTTQLGAEMFDICTALRHRGVEFEERHKSELDKFFAAIRQAVCREGGELGLPCRLKVLELLELRLLGWRNNLSHAQYYSKRDRQLDSHQSAPINSPSSPMAPPLPCNEQQRKEGIVPLSPSAAMLRQIQSPPHTVMPPFTPFAVPPPVPPPPTAPSCLLGSPDFSIQIPSSGYLFIPSRAGNAFIPAIPTNFPVTQNATIFGGTQQTSSLLSTSLFGEQFPKNGLILGMNKGTQKMSPHAKSFEPRLLEGMADPAGTMGKAKAAQQQQLREEMTIRNSDSGKVMGVKGRRVALIEAISKTVISFQKVDPKCKERLLTIIADTPEAIECARRLIADTIERNVSPERQADLPSGRESILMEKAQFPPVQAAIDDSKSFRVVQEADGSIRIASDDPSILEAAQTMLREYLKNVPGEDLRAPSIGNGGANQDSENAKGTVPLVYDRNTLLNLRQKSLEEKFLKEARKKLEKLDIFTDEQQLNETHSS